MLRTTKADAKTVEDLFEALLGRSINNDKFKAESDKTESIQYWIERLTNSDEFKARVQQKFGSAPASKDFIPDAQYRTPRLLPVQAPEKVLITGSCFSLVWSQILQTDHPQMAMRQVVFNNASEMEDIAIGELKQYAFQIAQIPLRSVISESEYFQQSGGAADEATFANFVARLNANFEVVMKYKRQMNIPVFVLNFATPQANPLGPTMPRYQLSNFVYVVERLNQVLADFIKAEGGVYLIDYDAISSTIGKRYLGDDITNHLNHGAFIAGTYWPEDIALTPYGSIDDIYRPKVEEAVQALFNECLATFYTISPMRKIKIVIFDLDGTLWRGVPAEAEDVDYGRISEGWPLSLVEAAAFLKKRGILLAIASKNDPAFARDLWEKIYGRRFPMSNFASVRISWDSKIKSVGEILSEVNLLPQNCLFVDDNPIEREQVANAYPGLLTIQGPISTWKRTLLWAAELQTPTITAESTTRTESIQKMIQRESLKSEVDPTDYLRSLNVQVEIETISGASDKKFARVYELLNKTNQFNTTGRRWSEAELSQLLSSGGRLYAAAVSDRLSNYGLTALLVEEGGDCTQMVMSCRVFGLHVEHAMLDHFLKSRINTGPARIAFKHTNKNGPSAKFLTSLGLALDKADADAIALYPLPSPLENVAEVAA